MSDGIDAELHAACARVAELARASYTPATAITGLIKSMMRPTRRYSALRQSQAKQAAALYAGGASVREVAAALRVSAVHIYTLLHEAGVSLRPQGRLHAGSARKMVAMYEAGATLEQVGAHHGVTRERVRQVLRSMGVASRSTYHPDYIARRQAVKADRVAQIVAAYEAGSSPEALAAEYGIRVASIRFALRRAGVSLRLAPLRQQQKERQALACALFDAGVSFTEITRRAGYKSEASCRGALIRLGRTATARLEAHDAAERYSTDPTPTCVRAAGSN